MWIYNVETINYNLSERNMTLPFPRKLSCNCEDEPNWNNEETWCGLGLGAGERATGRRASLWAAPGPQERWEAPSTWGWPARGHRRLWRWASILPIQGHNVAKNTMDDREMNGTKLGTARQGCSYFLCSQYCSRISWFWLRTLSL